MNRRAALLLIIACIAENAACEVDASVFFRDSTLSHVRLSPDGNQQAMVVEDDAGFTLSVRNSATHHVQLILDSRKLLERNINGVLDVGWIDNRNLVLILVEDRTAIADLIETKSQRHTYFVDVKKPPQSRDDIVSIKTSGWLVHTLPQQSGKFLYAKSGINSRVYSIDVNALHPIGRKLSKMDRLDGGQFSLENVVAEIEGFVYRWFIKVDGTIVAALVRNDEDELVLMETGDSGKSWTRLKVLVESPQKDEEDKKTAGKSGSGKKKDGSEEAEEKAELLIPIAYAGTPGRYYAVLEKEQTPDSLYLCDFTQDGKELLYQHATADIFQVRTSSRDYRLLSVGISNRGEPQFIYFDDQHAGIFNKVKQKGYQGYLALSESDLQGKNHIIYNFSSNNPGALLLYNEPKNEVSRLGDAVPGVPRSLNSELIVDELKVDGLSIEYFLSKPKGGSGKYPLVVIPHGGPIGVSDHRLYDPLTQYLVANGLAVLQVNYRGSAGYGMEFIEAGRKQWGSGVLSDIYGVLGVVRKRQDIAADRVCIAGGSYGGYAALALAIKYPDEFRCAASLAGVTDVQLMTGRLDIGQKGVDWYKENVGDPEQEADYLKQISPVYNASMLKVPVLLAHGADDDVVDVEHLYRMSYALARLKIPHDKIILDEVGHGFDKSRDAAEFYSRLYKFLREHLR